MSKQGKEPGQKENKTKTRPIKKVHYYQGYSDLRLILVHPTPVYFFFLRDGASNSRAATELILSRCTDAVENCGLDVVVITNERVDGRVGRDIGLNAPEAAE